MTTPPDQDGLEPAGAPPEPARLIVLTGADKGTVYPLPRSGTLSIGRGGENDIVVHDGEASKHHARIVADDGVYRFEDLGSTNGSFLNGERVSHALLASGAEIRLGHATFTVVLPEPAALPPEPDEPKPALPRSKPRRLLRRLAAPAAAVLLAAVLAAVWARTGPPLFAGRHRVIQVTSTPTGAEVYVDDQYVGLTPVELQVRAGSPHALRLTKHGHQPWRIAITRHTGPAVAAELLPELAATLFVSASKPDTKVFLDGSYVGQTGSQQPLRIPNVSLGQHELRFQKPNYDLDRQRIDVTRAGSLRVHGKLRSRQESSILYLISKQPRSALLYTELGHVHMVNRQLDKAMAAYKKAFELVYDGKDSSSYDRRLRAEVQKIIQGPRGVFHYGTEDEVRVACEKLEDVFVDLSGRHPRARTRLDQLASTYQARGHKDDAIRLYRKMLKARPTSLDLYYRVAQLCMSKNDYEAAVTVLKQAALRFPDTWGVEFRLGQAYLGRAESDLSENDRRQAIAHLERALRLCPSSTSKRTIQHDLDRARNLKIE